MEHNVQKVCRFINIEELGLAAEIGQSKEYRL